MIVVLVFAAVSVVTVVWPVDCADCALSLDVALPLETLLVRAAGISVSYWAEAQMPVARSERRLTNITEKDCVKRQSLFAQLDGLDTRGCLARLLSYDWDGNERQGGDKRFSVHFGCEIEGL